MTPDLSQAIASGATVVTPNRRLALALKGAFDDAQVASGHIAWNSADILPLSAFVGRAYEDALHSDLARPLDLPLLLAPAQELALWEQIIRGSDAGNRLLALPETARLACDAWQTAQAWRLASRIKDYPLNEDSRAFLEWMRRYERASKSDGNTDAARLPDVVAPLFGRGHFRTPPTLVYYGFDVITPQHIALFEALKLAGCNVVSAGPPPRRGDARRTACKDNRDEIRCAAAWARMQLERGVSSIGIVVPDLARHRAAIVRAFGATMAPGNLLPGALKQALPFNVSLGLPLTSYPLVHAALNVLVLAGREIDFEQASRLIRSPFLAGGDAEMALRARLDAALRERMEPVIRLERLLALITRSAAGCPVLAQRLGALAEYRKANLFGAQMPSVWARRISEALATAGFPGERSLDSEEYQTLKKWHETIAAFAALDRVVARMGYGEAISRLRRMATGELFQPETPVVPIQILGVFEAAGMTFDRLWVMGLSDEAWPAAPRPNPFLPLELQRAAGVPQGSAAEAIELARQLTRHWLTAADEVVLSYPQIENDREFKASPLIEAIPEQPVTPKKYAGLRDVIHAARSIEWMLDPIAPALEKGADVSAGTAAIKDYAACPFRAFARHRVGAEGLAVPHTGLDALERGTLVHHLLAQVWARLKNKTALDAISAADLDLLLEHAAEEALARARRDRPEKLSGRFAHIEKHRLVCLARDWLESERGRSDFTVVATEDKRRVEIGGLAFNSRLDRVDALPDGRHIVIDYKTNAPSPGALLGERPDEPQLPVYLTTAEPDAAAVAFAQVKTGDMKFVALARDADLLPGAKAFSGSPYNKQHVSWQDLVAAWRADLGRLAAGFATGGAAVDPKNYPHTCRYCDVQPFCRIYERLENTLIDDEDAA